MYMSDKKNIFVNSKFYKKMLCNNMIKHSICSYKTKCMYAHSLEEQKLEDIRQQAYDIIKSDYDLSNIDLKNNIDLFNNLLSLTNVCNKCVNGICPGGYNCKFGAINNTFRICYVDLTSGNCIENCKHIHLTKRGLIPFMNNTIDKNDNSNESDSSCSLDFDNSSSDENEKINSIFKY